MTRAQHEIRRWLEPEQSPQHLLLVGFVCEVFLPTVRGRNRDRVDEVAIWAGQLIGPCTSGRKRVFESLARLTVEFAHTLGHLRQIGGTDAALIQVLVGLGRDLEEPVRPVAAPLGQESIEDMGRRHVEQDVRAVLAADEIHVIDSQIGRDLVVSGRASGPLPFDPVGHSTTQAIWRVQKAFAVIPGLRELRNGFASGQFIGEKVVLVIGDVMEPVGTNSQCPVDARKAEHGKTGHNLGDLGTRTRHLRLSSQRLL